MRGGEEVEGARKGGTWGERVMRPVAVPPPKGQRTLASYFGAPTPVSKGTVKREGAADEDGDGDVAVRGPARAQATATGTRVAPQGPSRAETMTVELVAEEEAAAEAVAAAPAALPRRGGARQKEGEARAWGTAPGLLVGRKVRVLWAEDGKWYEGSVGGFSGGDGKHKVRYADGGVAWLELWKGSGQRWEPLEDADEGADDGGLHEDAETPGPVTPNPAVEVGVTGRVRKRVDYKAQLKSGFDFDSESDAAGSGEEEESEEEFKAGGRRGTVVDDDSDEDSDVSLEEEGDDDLGSEGSDFEPRYKKKRVGAGVGRGVGRARAEAAKSKGSTNAAKASALPVPPVARAAAPTPTLGASPAAARRPASPALVDVDMADLGSDMRHSNTPRARAQQPWLLDDVRDAQKRRPGEPGYDPSTLFVPQSYLKDKALCSECDKVWWDFKAKNFNAVIFFKMGKFYELFEMDAHVGVKELGLGYMKDPNKPHAGFPEKALDRYASMLANKGYRVVVVEQTETPEMASARTGKKSAQVKREKCAVLTKGTITEDTMLPPGTDTNWLISVTDGKAMGTASRGDDGACVVGICAVDATSGLFLLREFEDDVVRAQLRTVLACLKPVEVLQPRDSLSAPTLSALRQSLADPLVTERANGTQFPSCAAMLANLEAKKYWGEGAPLPAALAELVAAGSDTALSAFGAVVNYLQDILLDKALVGLGNVAHYDPSGATPSAGARQQSQEDDLAYHQAHMDLDGPALMNLEILENSEGGKDGSLLQLVDHCVSPFGRRTLREWMVRPLISAAAIRQRQDAVAALTEELDEACGALRKCLKGVADVPRMLSRIHANSFVQRGDEGGEAVRYENADARKIEQFVRCMRGLATLDTAAKSLAQAVAQAPEVATGRLRRLVTPKAGGGLYPDGVASKLREFEGAFDWNEACKEGKVSPSHGVDPEYDAAMEAVNEIEVRLEGIVRKERAVVGAGVCFYSAKGQKERYQLEVPDALKRKVPSHYSVVSQRKGFTRYWTPEIRDEVDALVAAEERRSVALSDVLKNLLASFGRDFAMWKQVANCMGEVDCLASLAVMARGMDQPCCRPTVLDDTDAEAPPALAARGLRHPCLSLDPSRAFIPNDTELGGPAPHFLLLTGPNMGGKSTLLRQVCLATVLAQMGAWVPAESFALVPVDRLFVRMGARDNILAGESTFFVELAETAAMLRGATRRSLVALDELGRGTSTSDGAAIAHAVTQHLTQNVGCRAMFATHYHTLSDDFAPSGAFSLRHMGCDVTHALSPSGGAAEPLKSATSDADVTFLYKLRAGPCPRSFGLNVARLAGMPEPVVKRAAEQGRLLEQMFMEKTGKSHDGRDEREAIDREGVPNALSGEEIRLLKAVVHGGWGAGGSESLPSLSRRVRSSFVF